jgi:hypothetical protein
MMIIDVGETEAMAGQIRGNDGPAPVGLQRMGGEIVSVGLRRRAPEPSSCYF